MSGDAILNCGGRPRCGTCRMCRALAALTREPEREFEALPTQSPNPMGTFSLHVKPPRRGQSFRSRQIDALLESLGYGRR